MFRIIKNSTPRIFTLHGLALGIMEYNYIKLSMPNELMNFQHVVLISKRTAFGFQNILIVTCTMDINASKSFFRIINENSSFTRLYHEVKKFTV